MTEPPLEPPSATSEASERGSALEVLAVATRLGLTSFGGPVAHLGYFRAEYVRKRGWLTEEAFADLVALCQFLPGPASSQVGIAIGLSRAGLPGAFLSWLGFTMPSAVLLVLFGLGLQAVDVADTGWLHGLKVVAVAVVALAVWGMARSLAPDAPRLVIAALAAAAVTLLDGVLVPVAVIAIAGIVGWRLLRTPDDTATSGAGAPIASRRVGRRLAIASWVAFFVLLLGLPLARGLTEAHSVALTDSMYRVGSLVFGGGHVVLPLMAEEVVEPGWVTQDEFTAGYGAAQAVPGPLFAFSAYLGAVEQLEPNGVPGAALALGAVYLPSFLLLLGALPIWDALRGRPEARSALRGVNAAVVGLLAAALYDPVWTSAIDRPIDLGLALAGLGALALLRWPPWLVVALSALGGAAIEAV